MTPCKHPDAPVMPEEARPDALVVIGQIQEELAQLQARQRALLAQLERRETGSAGRPARTTPAVALVATGIALIKASLR